MIKDVNYYLSTVSMFTRVYIDDTHCIAWDKDPNVDSDVIWSNKIDLCPDSSYIDSVPLDSAKNAG